MSSFFSCYLLTSLNKRYKEHSYIGFTVDPRRRLRQHNGELRNGAQKTSNKQPWEMVVVVHGFPYKKMALYFEWAWQHPYEAKGIKEVMPTIKRIGRRGKLKANIRVLYELLQCPPWNNLPLQVHWLTEKYNMHLDKCPSPPSHIIISEGPIDDLEMKEGLNISQNQEDMDDNPHNLSFEPETLPTCICVLCKLEILNYSSSIYCDNEVCNTPFHVTCLADSLSKVSNVLIPVCGNCVACDKTFYWKNLLDRKKAFERLWILKEYNDEESFLSL